MRRNQWAKTDSTYNFIATLIIISIWDCGGHWLVEAVPYKQQSKKQQRGGRRPYWGLSGMDELPVGENPPHILFYAYYYIDHWVNGGVK